MIGRGAQPCADYLSASAQPICMPSFIGADTVDEVTALALSKPPQQGRTHLDYGEARRCLIARIFPGELSRLTAECISQLSQSMREFFPFDYTQNEPELNFIRYTDGEFFDWHLDMSPNGSMRRKLSFSIQLTPDAEYDGGDLEFFPEVRLPSARKVGSVIVFPPFVPHRVTPVSRGTRYALVGWLYGPPFK